MTDSVTDSDLIHQVHADLRWLHDCPPLLDSDLNLELPPPPSDLTEQELGPIRRFLESKASHRVGYYVESLIQVWLETAEGIEEVRHGIQVRSGKTTLGEIDFLFRKDGKLHHLEVALKFYLFDPDRQRHGSYFIGPNAADTFERKRDKLLSKQLPLGRKTFPEIESSRIFLKGILFYPIETEPPSHLPDRMNPQHARGTWFREGDFQMPFAEGVVALPKPWWVSGEVPSRYGNSSLTIGVPNLLSWPDASCDERWLRVPSGWPIEASLPSS